jgi:UDP-N-acetylmuramyl tripeptide synthase
MVRLPGTYNQGNALMALAAASALGVTAEAAAAAIAQVRTVAHRYAVCQYGAQRLTLLLAKNPAGWRETLPLAQDADGLLLAVNAREADGRDTSWLWDVPFEELPQRPVVAAGEAAADVALRLAYADISHQAAADPVQALRLLPPGDIAVVANYTAFAELWHRLDRDGRS